MSKLNKTENNKWAILMSNFKNDSSLLESVTNTFIKQLIDDGQKYDLNENVSDCAIYVPYTNCKNEKSIEVARRIAITLYPYDDSDKSVDVKKIHTYIQYSKYVAKLRKQYRKQEIKKEKENKKDNVYKDIRKNGNRKNFCTMKKKPVSNLITNPVPMPVDIAPIKELQPFFDYLKENKQVIIEGDIKDKYIEFERGVHYEDGRIDLCKQVVGNLWIGDLMESIQNNSHVNHFLLGNNIIGPVGAASIANFINLEHVPKIKTWYLAGNEIDSDGIKLIAKALEKDVDCEALWLKRNPLKPEGIKYISEMLKVNKSIKILDLHNTGMLDEGCKYLFEGLRENTTLRTLYIDANGITVEGAKYIADYFDYLVTNNIKGVTSIWMCINRFGDEGIINITKSLKQYYYLERLSIASNRIEVNGCKEVLNNLVDHKNLIVLDLGLYKSTSDLEELPNNIGDEGAEHVATFIENNKSVKILDVVHNDISIIGLQKMADALDKNNNISCLFFSQYGISIPKDIKTQIKTKLTNNIYKEYNISTEEFMMTKHRFMKHTSDVQYIDSIYRNAM
jgi:Ran GTPase-activating protein (RanGAP) involved in mRNA processing and transport